VIAIFLTFGLIGCGQQGYSVLAVTSTIIGVEVSQNPANQTPQAKLGYNRTEVAFVPTNRDAGEKAGTSWSGAKDSADVIMELRYGGIFDLGASSGIYQRLAVGNTAVQQPGASLMFGKDAEGKVDKNASDALTTALTTGQVEAARALAEKQVAEDDRKIALIVSKVAPNGTVDTTALSQALEKTSGVPTGIKNRLKAYTTAEQLTSGLQVVDHVAVDPLYQVLNR